MSVTHHTLADVILYLLPICSRQDICALRVHLLMATHTSVQKLSSTKESAALGLLKDLGKRLQALPLDGPQRAAGGSVSE